jgi:hypothetical protein
MVKIKCEFSCSKPEKYSQHTDYTGGPQMMDKHSLYGPPFPTGPYDNYSMRSYSPGGSYRGVAILPEIQYDNSAYQGEARFSIFLKCVNF